MYQIRISTHLSDANPNLKKSPSRMSTRRSTRSPQSPESKSCTKVSKRHHRPIQTSTTPNILSHLSLHPHDYQTRIQIQPRDSKAKSHHEKLKKLLSVQNKLLETSLETSPSLSVSIKKITNSQLTG
ncbi:hypothetical protein Dimus_039167 [Dionaea muscipula]